MKTGYKVILVIQEGEAKQKIAELLKREAPGFDLDFLSAELEFFKILEKRTCDVVIMEFSILENSIRSLNDFLHNCPFDLPVILLSLNGQMALSIQNHPGIDSFIIFPDSLEKLPEIILTAISKRHSKSLQRTNPDKEKLTDGISRSKQELNFLFEISTSACRFSDFRSTMQSLFKKMLSQFPFYGVVLWMIDSNSNHFGIKYYEGLTDSLKSFLSGPLISDFVMDGIRNSGKSFFIQIETDSLFYSPPILDAGIKSMYFCPLMIDKQVIGALQFLSLSSKNLASEKENFFELSVLHLSGAIENILFVEKLSEQANRFRESDTNYRALLENAGDSIFIIQHKNIVFINKAGIDLLAYPVEEILGKPFLNFVVPENIEKAEIIQQRQLNYQDVPNFELKLLNKTGEEIVIDLKGAVVEYRGQPAYQFIGRDITQHKKIQRRLHQSEKLASLGQLISGIAHELNNPLTSMLGFSELLMDNVELQPKFQRYLQVINHQSTRAKNIVQNLLAFARQHPAEKISVNLKDMINDTIKLRQYELQVNNITIETYFDDVIPEILADPNQLQEVFLNLLVNAEQAILSERNSGMIRIVCQWNQQLEPVDILFIDNGPGISPEIKDKIFRPFITTKPVGKGTGLGLSISHGIIKEHGGSITLKETNGNGACFLIQLPVLKTEDAKREPESYPERVIDPVICLGSKSILLIDDEEAILEILSEILELQGHRVTAVRNAMNALNYISKDTFDLILCDIKMPGMNGKQFYREVKNIDFLLAQRIIFTTGDTMGSETQDFLRNTKNRYIGKPFRIEELLSLIQEFFLENGECKVQNHSS
ncbi:MAG: hypothetical protein A2161_15525 [Candidatus Schekmanbacteria bacterium RBG_13_48_7]|uniref:histidine kinase n=1 Tax=Candidatus Schekmanbacteria bacterium RBG_13_48_7 TaxID=1817878 RepID=A0A1F7RNS7_9BACT|nr:MAG: hypothetical protein A2161_15525 [Candidatus Schekmanbacteria bacterium RBG_13_48_7]